MTREDHDIPIDVKGAAAAASGHNGSPDVASQEAPVESRSGESAPVGAPEPQQAVPAEGPARAEDWQNRYLRLAAEFDNYRKRSARDFNELVRNAERDLIAELTDVLDSFDRALDADHKGESLTHFTEGVSLIRDQVLTALTKRGLERMQTVGLPFDPGLHDALMQMPTDQCEAGIVVQEVSPGYMLGSKVLRHARVVVSSGRDDARATNGQDEMKDEA